MNPRKSWSRLGWLGRVLPTWPGWVGCVWVWWGVMSVQAGSFQWHLRTRERDPADSNAWRVVEKEAVWDASRTAVVICDMWDKHWCPDATERVGEMAPVMNRVVQAARSRGALIIHCPSDTLKYYKDHPGRKLAQAAPKVETKVPLKGWCSLQNEKEGPLPIDDSDGGCDGCPDCPSYGAWTRQHPALEILEGDAITDSAEAFYLMRQRGITNVLVMGVHANMCVLGRPFSIRQMVAQGQNVVLMRDMTDSMYNHRKRPYVSHFRGTELVVEHVEKYWCASVTSADVLGGEPFRFQGDVRKKVVFVVGENEYQTSETLRQWADTQLKWRGYSYAFVEASSQEGATDFKNVDEIRTADVLVLSVRRRTPPQAMMDLLRAHVAGGKPVVGIRTASHAFDATPKEAGYAGWSLFDTEVLGADYQGHYGNKPPQGAHTVVRTVSGQSGHPVLTGVHLDSLAVTSHLYKYRDLAPTVTSLVEGWVEGKPELRESVAWVNGAADRRVFYTSMGNPDDFKIPAFARLLLNGVLWSMREFIPPGEAPRKNGTAQWQPMAVPGAWEDQSGGALADYDGYAWYRCKVVVPETWQEGGVVLRVEQVDNVYEAFVNGVRVGGAGGFPPSFSNGLGSALEFQLPATATRTPGGWNVAIRVYDDGGRGGFKGAAPLLRRGEQSITLRGAWDFRTGDDLSWAKEDAKGVASVFQVPAVQASPATASTVPSANMDLPQETTSPPLTPQESLKHFEVASDLEWELVLSEPEVAQPVFLNFDERGRMWVVQYRQYPWPAGLKLVSRDSVWRNVYDRVPPAPPHHFKGADRITIHEDTDGDGTFDRMRIFVDGLSIVTAVERGRGGVWVLNPPYLLFYADANGDDVPDGDPVVHLSGFGLEDTHSVANSLRWGADGWLYGAQGSTVTANIVRPGLDKEPILHTMGQQIWRYHPDTRRFETFSEGGGNAFGCELDAQGRVFSGHNGGDTRGFHYDQGAYLQKGFDKHGPLSNPYAYGYFGAIPHHSVARFTHNFVIYEADGLPERYRGRLFGVEPLQGRIVESEILPDRSSFKTRDIRRVVTSSDRWFRPVDIKAGPDGALYVCDWYDMQVNHYRNHEGKMDASNGRVYRLKSKGARAVPPVDLAKKSSVELAALLTHPNKWYRQTVRRLLSDRRDGAAVAFLRERWATAAGQAALETFWALEVLGGWEEQDLVKALGHGEPQVRLWASRLLGDRDSVTGDAAQALAARAREERDLEVRKQMAATARRLPARQGLPVLGGLLRHSEDAEDPRLPLMCWWALEGWCGRDSATILVWLEDTQLWDAAVMKSHLLERLARRWAQSGSRQDLVACARLFELSPSVVQARLLKRGFELGIQGRPMGSLPDSLLAAMARAGVGSLALELRQSKPGVLEKALARISDPHEAREERVALLRALAEVKNAELIGPLIRVLRGSAGDDGLRVAALSALEPYDDPRIADAVLGLYTRFGPQALPSAQRVLASRPSSALTWVRALSKKSSGWSGPSMDPGTVPLSVVRALKRHPNRELAGLTDALWPEAGAPTTEEMEKKIRSFEGQVRGGTGDPYHGRALFQNQCGTCHKLFGKGAEVGPDLTVFKRDDLGSMLLSIVNPSAEIREGYEQYSLETKDGRSLSGFLVEQDAKVVVLRALDGQNISMARTEIEQMSVSRTSLMPEGLLDRYTEKDVRDLFAYLRSTQPLVGEPPKSLERN